LRSGCSASTMILCASDECDSARASVELMIFCHGVENTLSHGYPLLAQTSTCIVIPKLRVLVGWSLARQFPEASRISFFYPAPFLLGRLADDLGGGIDVHLTCNQSAISEFNLPTCFMRLLRTAMASAGWRAACNSGTSATRGSSTAGTARKTHQHCRIILIRQIHDQGENEVLRQTKPVGSRGITEEPARRGWREEEGVGARGAAVDRSVCCVAAPRPRRLILAGLAFSLERSYPGHRRILPTESPDSSLLVPPRGSHDQFDRVNRVNSTFPAASTSPASAPVSGQLASPPTQHLRQLLLWHHMWSPCR
jgi:hypothetical protein